jgi:hypothetical protein
MRKKYEKGDIEMISNVMNLPKAKYSDVVTLMKQNEIANKTINDWQLAVCDKWERLELNKRTKKKDEDSLFVKGNFTKKFKGICGYCGKQGHKKETCFKKKCEDGEKGKGDSSNNMEGEKDKVKNPNIIICFHGKKKGHPAFMCPDKDKETGMLAFNFNIEEIVLNDGWKTWQWANWIDDNDIDVTDAYYEVGTTIIENEDNQCEKNANQNENNFVIVNRYGTLYESDSDDECSEEGGEDKEDFDYELLLPTRYQNFYALDSNEVVFMAETSD